MSTLAAFTIGVHLATAHIGGHDLQTINPGINLRVCEGDFAGLTLGTYRNSYNRRSTYAAWSWQTENQRFAITAGAVTGYSAARLMPLLVPSTRVPIGTASALRIAFIPKPVKDGHAAGVHFSLERDF